MGLAELWACSFSLRCPSHVRDIVCAQKRGCPLDMFNLKVKELWWLTFPTQDTADPRSSSDNTAQRPYVTLLGRVSHWVWPTYRLCSAGNCWVACWCCQGQCGKVQLKWIKEFKRLNSPAIECTEESDGSSVLVLLVCFTIWVNNYFIVWFSLSLCGKPS